MTKSFTGEYSCCRFASLFRSTNISYKQPRDAPHPDADQTRHIDILERFERSDNLRAFVVYAKNNPDQGGYFYSLLALAQCNNWERNIQIQSMDLPHAVAQNRDWRNINLTRRCSFFIEDDLDPEQVEFLWNEGKSQRDPLILASRNWLDAVATGNYATMSTALDDIFFIGDPMLVAFAGQTGSDYWHMHSSPEINGQTTEKDMVTMAWRLLPCRLGRDCTQGDEQAEIDCVFFGRCQDNMWDAVTEHLTAAEQHRLNEEINYLETAVKNRDANSIF